ncbi:sensor histidine kinase [Paenibacillus sp. V4I7]|uniref:cache domain-containing sensor histidine kinase n=1 Tax=Paenibacillus sp. V4I7 TaxID=3042307 RepID=UPI00277EEED0|nr:sensor histidine kinase [Paenibacillus sp. V4I7]MDQ0899396.1 two-component system sensor histidine kinase YesM [Paenibacillus sp. V4I7]
MKLIYRISFQQRVWIGFIFVVTVAVAATGLLSYRIAANISESNAYKLSQDTLNKTSQALDEKLGKVRTSIFSMIMNPDYQKAVGFNANSIQDANYYTYLSSMQDVYVQLRTIEPMIVSALVATPNGNYYQITQALKPKYSFYQSDLYQRIMAQKGKHREVWVEGHEDAIFEGGKRFITFVTEGILNDVSREVFVVANIKEDELKRFVYTNLNWRDGSYMLVNQQGLDVFQSDADANFSQKLKADPHFIQALQQQDGFFEYEANRQHYMINFTKLKVAGDWTLFSILPKSQLFEQLESLKWTIMTIIISCLLIGFIFARFMTRFLMKPLLNLQHVMLKVENNDWSVRFQSDYVDEITQVGFRFNRMLDEINRLFQEVSVAEKEKHISEMKALQAQIAPHFLYNTLNTIYWKSQLEQSEAVQKMVLDLSKLFQLGLNKGGELTTLKNELQHMEHYLLIQQECYENLFDYFIELDEGIDVQQSIVKIIIQPLVENAILHGFKNRHVGGEIKIAIKQSERYLILTVEDNGEGMVVGASGVQREQSANSSGYALFNIQRRLELHYGSEATVKVESEIGAFTRITLMIPRIGGNLDEI